MGDLVVEPTEALRALEQFVIENDDLLELEERIGRFNIFDGLRIARTEIRHSNFLAWLLDPNESHGVGSLFLRSVVMDLLSRMPHEKRPLSPVDLDGAELHGAEIRREWRHIDILITCEQPRFVIAIENKVDSGEGKEQLGRYEETVHKEFPDISQPIFVYLTREGDEASDEDWVPYSYADIHRVLSRAQRTNAGSIGDDVNAFLEHYLRLIGSRFMDDPKIDELCRKIYQNHRQALELIFQRVGMTRRAYLNDLESLLTEESSPWIIVGRGKNFISFCATKWQQQMPPWGSYRDRLPQYWLVFTFETDDGSCWLHTYLGPFDNEQRRLKVAQALGDNSSLGFTIHAKTQRAMSKGALPEWTSLGWRMTYRWGADSEPDIDKLISSAQVQLDDLAQRIEPIPALISNLGS